MREFARILLLALAAVIAQPVAAQQSGSWLQIEARPGLAAAQESAAGYAQAIADVNGFRLGGTSWYAIVLGPFDEVEADLTRRELRAQGLIPGDAFVTDGGAFGEQFWPIGAATPAPVTPEALDGGVSTAALPDDDAPTGAEAPDPEVAATPEAEPDPLPVADETRPEALRSERSLTRADREALQVALRWAGFYDASIDGAFGTGTRGAMSDWQEANGYEPTGVLTTLQRAALLRDYNSVLDDLGMRLVRDDTAGIALEMPTERVAFDRYQPPFAHYPARDEGDPAQVLLISQRGDRRTLFGLYDIMQTLEIVPPEGPRERGEASFTLTGANDEIVSHTEAQLSDGQIKGFTLIWPAGDEQRRTRMLDEMRASFAPDPGVVLEDAAGEPGEDQSVDLLAGLEIRRPELVRSGFYVSRGGEVLTSADATEGCSRVTLGDDFEARVLAVDEAAGLALLEPAEVIAPRGVAALQSGVPRLGSEAVLAGYSYGGMLGAPSLTYGELADMRGLDGDEAVKRFTLAARDGDAGGPIFDTSGAVMGMLLARETGSGRSLPDDVALAADVETLVEFLSGNGIEPVAAERGQPLPRGVLESRALDMTVLVGCWK